MKAYRRFKRCIGQGNLWLYVVSILNKRGPLHGYAIIQEIRKFGFNISTVYGYVLLKRMVADGVLVEVVEGARSSTQLAPKRFTVNYSDRSYR